MGMYDTYGETQLKIGPRELDHYEIGNVVLIPNGIYVAPDGVVVIVEGRFVAEFDRLYSKWGDEISLDDIVKNPLIEVIESVRTELAEEPERDSSGNDNKPMTRDGILNATPEQLRLWVSELMGWTKLRCYAADEDLWGQPPGTRGDPGMTFFQQAPDYPNNIAATQRVWRHVLTNEGESCNLEMSLTSDVGGWECVFALEGWAAEVSRATGKTECEAVCKATLLTKLEKCE